MIQPTQNQSTRNPLKSDTGTGFVIDYKKLLADLLRFWWLFVITLSLSLFTVYMIHRYAQPVYRAALTLLVEERGSDKPQSNMMEGFGLSTAMRSIENQIAILTSWELMRMAVSELDFEISYYKTGRVKSSELYGGIPFTVEYDRMAPQLLNAPIYLSVIDQHRFKLSIEAEAGSTYIFGQQRAGSATGPINYSQEFSYGEWIETPWMKIKIENGDLSRPEERAFYFHFNSPDALASIYKSRFTHGRSNDNSSIVRLYLTGHNNAKNVTFLNKLAEVFIRNNLERKNQIATNTIQFIEEQLIIISDSLSVKGTELSEFRTFHQIQSVSAQAGIYFSRLENLAEQTSQMMLTKKYYEYLNKYFSADTLFDGTIAPASYPVDNATITQHIATLMELNMEQQAISANVSQNISNPYLIELNSKMEVARQTLLKVLENQMAMMDQELNRIERERRETTAELYQFPEKERQLFGIERQFDLNNEVYTFLLRKRSEAQIQKASNTPDHSILEMARPAGQVSPTVKSDRQKALMIGLIIPFLFLLIRQLLNNKISNTEDIERITRLPVIGHILHNVKEGDNVVDLYPKSVITETFRRIRSRLEYMTGDKKCPVIAISSSMPGEGKTFCALNLASVFAISGKKTLLVGFDMRKPGLNKVLNLHNQDGLSNYLIGKAELKDIIQESSPGNLFILPSGAIPPNPSELIGSPRAEKLFEELKANFDIILLDTPPMG
ncbi:MAG: polysaccharide biosynthesis tyrosine autokinase, partial [Bacteroidales bacterium]|nr:polysaccharide biosynthesis tyrosine autokinase [Bacteroidales bacterium]